MIAQVVSRCEVYMTNEEQELLNKVIAWIEGIPLEDYDNMPEGVQEMLSEIVDNAQGLLDLIPEEH